MKTLIAQIDGCLKKLEELNEKMAKEKIALLECLEVSQEMQEGAKIYAFRNKAPEANAAEIKHVCNQCKHMWIDTVATFECISCHSSSLKLTLAEDIKKAA